MKSNEKAMKKQWKAMKSYEKLWKAMTSNEKQWKSNEKMRKDEMRWEEKRREERRDEIYMYHWPESEFRGSHHPSCSNTSLGPRECGGPAKHLQWNVSLDHVGTGHEEILTLICAALHWSWLLGSSPKQNLPTLGAQWSRPPAIEEWVYSSSMVRQAWRRMKWWAVMSSGCEGI